ncbi:hypothetical protein SBD_1640 [Streptomyces bottropensis ATCC 25435]|uniref:Uncharacterized protein n=1 Tax=Streptomyces bottropensis ATCC 25435 TaxID=1054862 RepID=M3FXY0_9ACTN|nr:hypothetical protein SBD_1640 [Streptomyces bottropensis ATCC 25435]
MVRATPPERGRLPGDSGTCRRRPAGRRAGEQRSESLRRRTRSTATSSSGPRTVSSLSSTPRHRAFGGVDATPSGDSPVPGGSLRDRLRHRLHARRPPHTGCGRRARLLRFRHCGQRIPADFRAGQPPTGPRGRHPPVLSTVGGARVDGGSHDRAGRCRDRAASRCVTPPTVADRPQPCRRTPRISLRGIRAVGNNSPT